MESVSVRSLAVAPQSSARLLSQSKFVAPRIHARRPARQPLALPRAAVEAPPAAPPPASPPQAAPPSPLARALRAIKLARAPPWAFVPHGSVLTIDLSGALPETAPGGLSLSSGPPSLTLPALCTALRCAAADDRIVGVYFKVGGLACGWAKLQEVARHVALFRASGKFSMAYLEVGGEKEYFAAAQCEELYTPPGAYVSLRGLSVQGTFLRGVLEKVGVEPQIKRIGKYKSAGDQLGRKDMSEAQREVSNALLDDIFGDWVNAVAAARGKSKSEVLALLDDPKGIFDMAALSAGGWITGTKYLDEIQQLLRPRTGGRPEELRAVTLARYSRTRPQSVGVDAGRPAIAILRASGGISRGRGGGGLGGGGGITNEDFCETARRLRGDRRVRAVVLRIDSPGGDALASDLMWREIRLLAREKPVVASMADVAASGGYYMAMAADKIVAERLTLTGSIGVITGKFNLEELFKKVGYHKEIISRGRFAEVDADNRSFTKEEEAYFDRNAAQAYASFRDKAAMSRGMEISDMEALAQGRVWTGRQAQERGLVDELGGLQEAVALARKLAGFKDTDQVSAVTYQQPWRMRAGPGAAVAEAAAAFQAARAGLAALARLRAMAAGVASGRPAALMEEVSAGGFAAGGAAEGRLAVMAAAEALLALGAGGGGAAGAAAAAADEEGDSLLL